MSKQNRSTIKTYFETGDVPTESQFSDSFDSQVFWNDDVATDLTSNDDDHVPTVKAVVDGIAAVANNFIPLAGTDSGHPLTGWVEASVGSSQIGSFDRANDAAGDGGNVHFIGDGVEIVGQQTDNAKQTILSVRYVTNGSVVVSSTDTSFKGIEEGSDYSANYSSLSLVNKGYVDSVVGGGDVVGPASSTNNHVAFFDGTTGKLLKDSGLGLSGNNTGDETTATIKTKLGAAETGADGYLTSTDWNTFNGKQAALGYTPANVANNLSDLTNTATAKTNLGLDVLLPAISTGADGTTVSGTTANTATYAILVDPKYITAGMLRNIVFGYRKTGTAGTSTVRLYFNTTANLSGSPILIGNSAALGATTLGAAFQRNVAIKVKNGTGAGTEVLNTSSTSLFDTGFSSTAAKTTIAPDFTGTLYLVAAIQLSNSGDSAVGTYLQMI